MFLKTDRHYRLFSQWIAQTWMCGGEGTSSHQSKEGAGVVLDEWVVSVTLLAGPWNPLRPVNNRQCCCIFTTMSRPRHAPGCVWEGCNRPHQHSLSPFDSSAASNITPHQYCRPTNSPSEVEAHGHTHTHTHQNTHTKTHTPEQTRKNINHAQHFIVHRRAQ